jgi:hypothetical protein
MDYIVKAVFLTFTHLRETQVGPWASRDLSSQHFGGGGRIASSSSGQPSKNLTSKQTNCQVQWLMPVILATGKMAISRITIGGKLSQQLHKIPSQPIKAGCSVPFGKPQ